MTALPAFHQVGFTFLWRQTSHLPSLCLMDASLSPSHWQWYMELTVKTPKKPWPRWSSLNTVSGLREHNPATKDSFFLCPLPAQMKVAPSPFSLKVPQILPVHALPLCLSPSSHCFLTFSHKTPSQKRQKNRKEGWGRNRLQESRMRPAGRGQTAKKLNPEFQGAH